MKTWAAGPADRFSNYIGVIRAVLRACELPTGNPPDLVTVAHELSSAGATREQMVGVLRDLLARADGGLTRAELASMFAVAVGGTEPYQTAEEVDAVGQLDSFVDSVMSEWELRELPSTPLIDSKAPVRQAEAMPESKPAGQPLGSVSPPSPGLSPPGELAPAGETDSHIAVALEPPLPGDDVARAIEPFWAVVEAPDTPAARSVHEVTPEQGPPRPAAVARRPERSGRAGWITAACAAALLAATAAVVSRHREIALPEPAEQTARTVPATGERTAPAASFGIVPNSAATPESPLSGRAPAGTASAGAGKDVPFAQAGQTRADKATGTPLASNTPGTPPPGPLPSPATTPSAVPPAMPRESERREHAPPRPTGGAGAAAVGPTGKFLVSSGVMGNNLVAAPAPAYPKMAKMWGVQGEVILQAVVSRKGQVVSAHVLDGHRMLRGAATNAVRKWRYRPYLVNGKPMDVDTIVIVNFKLPS